jgi:hypothetical protein
MLWVHEMKEIEMTLQEELQAYDHEMRQTPHGHARATMACALSDARNFARQHRAVDARKAMARGRQEAAAPTKDADL